MKTAENKRSWARLRTHCELRGCAGNQILSRYCLPGFNTQRYAKAANGGPADAACQWARLFAAIKVMRDKLGLRVLCLVTSSSGSGGIVEPLIVSAQLFSCSEAEFTDENGL